MLPDTGDDLYRRWIRRRWLMEQGRAEGAEREKKGSAEGRTQTK
uniref:Uncharacterized protein n=1 Tax=Nelumbo nucifera TaxID=4432 RepID=A0A822Y8V5_NELNU|nr:TPA_asm: hypothetical protein HUJ06_009345 [Nelumbo nucifera]